MMTLEALIADIEASGWIVWDLGRKTNGEWTCRLANPSHRTGAAGSTGFDNKDAWRHAIAGTHKDALVAAGRGLFSQDVEKQLTIAELLA